MPSKKRASRISEPSRSRPVVYDVDVAVAGGGVAGVFAALGAARTGAKTVLIERFGYPGGNIGPGMINAGGLAPKPVEGPDGSVVMTHVLGDVTGIPREFLDRHAALCGKDAGNLLNSNGAAYLAMKMMEEAGVEMMLSAYVSDPIVRRDRVEGVFVENKSGRQAVKAKVVIDATGEADVARRAGAPILYPKPEYTEVDHHAPTGAGLYYLIGGVSWTRFEKFEKQVKPSREDSRWWQRFYGTLDPRYAYLASCARKAWSKGEHRHLFGKGRLFQRDVEGIGAIKALMPFKAKQRQLAHRCTGFIRVDMGDGVAVAKAEAAARMCIYEMVQFYKDCVPGFEDAYLLCISPYLGARGGPCIRGEYTLQTEDFVEGKRFPDVLFVFGHVSGGKDVQLGHGHWTDYPYRVMLPKKLDGLIAVGRSASCIPDTLIRGRTKSMHAGEIGGIAAALAAKKRVTPKALDVKTLQRTLLRRGYYLGDAARLRELGLIRR